MNHHFLLLPKTLLVLSLILTAAFSQVERLPGEESSDVKEKLTINVLDGKDEVVDKIFVQNNPEEYTIEEGSLTREQEASAPASQQTTLAPLLLSMELVFDTYDEGYSVKKEVGKIHKLAHIDGEQHRSPTLMIVWGEGLKFKGILTYCKERYTKFLADGTPVRCVMNVRFTEHTTPTEQRSRTEYH